MKGEVRLGVDFTSDYPERQAGFSWPSMVAWVHGPLFDLACLFVHLYLIFIVPIIIHIYFADTTVLSPAALRVHQVYLALLSPEVNPRDI